MAKNKRVIIGLSGGIDSTVAAVFLKREGYDVAGLYIKNGYLSRSEEDAAHIADRLEIPFYVSDRSEEFKKHIIDYFIREYTQGRTPNPCTVCNKSFKFKYLIEKANELGMDSIATGHYARINHERGYSDLLKGMDDKKDQSYFLFMIGQDILARTIFPNGPYTKETIRKTYLSLGFTQTTVKESQEICFIPDNDYRHFVETKSHGLFSGPGNIVDTNGSIVGRHKGIHSVTIGQRRGLNIASMRPYYVIGISRDQNVVIVGRNEEQYFKGLRAKCIIWARPEYENENNFKVRALIRYRHSGVDSTVTMDGEKPNRANVCFDEPQKAVAPGQCVVFYKGDKVIGGGWIEEALKNG